MEIRVSGDVTGLCEELQAWKCARSQEVSDTTRRKAIDSLEDPVDVSETAEYHSVLSLCAVQSVQPDCTCTTYSSVPRPPPVDSVVQAHR